LRLDRRLWPSGPPRRPAAGLRAFRHVLCQGQTCSLPVTTPEALIALIEARREASLT
jgi:hypothetical protein